jgi:S1-C subfamily serine protease
MVFGGDLGVSIPSQVVLDWLATLKGNEPGYLGMGVQVTQLEVVLPGTNRPAKVAGLRVINLASTGPALKAGLQVGDILLEAGGERMSSTASLSGLLALLRPGTNLGMQVLRGENILRVTVAVGHQPLERAA